MGASVGGGIMRSAFRQTWRMVDGKSVLIRHADNRNEKFCQEALDHQVEEMNIKARQEGRHDDEIIEVRAYDPARFSAALNHIRDANGTSHGVTTREIEEFFDSPAGRKIVDY